MKSYQLTQHIFTWLSFLLSRKEGLHMKLFPVYSMYSYPLTRAIGRCPYRLFSLAPLPKQPLCKTFPLRHQNLMSCCNKAALSPPLVFLFLSHQPPCKTFLVEVGGSDVTARIPRPRMSFV